MVPLLVSVGGSPKRGLAIPGFGGTCAYAHRPPDQEPEDRPRWISSTAMSLALESASPTDRRPWQTLDQGSDPMAGAYKTILLTGCRPGEVLGLRWEEISEDGLWWVIPEERSKNGLAHRIFLTLPMREILEARRALAEASPLVFPATRGGSAPRTLPGPREASRRRRFEFNLHDLRRTASTHLARLGVRDEIREALLNHKKKGLRSVYNLYEYERKKQEALVQHGRRRRGRGADGRSPGKRRAV